ncbi:DEAD/DEAH box helicase family protein [Gordonia sp. SID5947]|uniref:DEAD/DEAH box helicase family protein n=1 Tax=Gordonia sp. SID5947 TaxID=2690315 RepID=UPI0013697E15|nr:DEAD/DEAH box helicase family protein [Gordonia sp. SID5947]MYR09017.1 DEAD/DEAH box helicase family protein [Gordonia sp. SID5947]
MKFTLKDYQVDAVDKILTRLGYAREDWRGRDERTTFALSSTTGSGKTVIAATVIEALLHGSDEFDVEADQTAVVLWVSKDPSLNEQTRGRFIECADRIPPGDLVLLDKTFAGDSLKTGKIYFINPDKLSKTADFVKHTDSRHYTFWEILDNTIADEDKTLYVVLDEAHEGMKASSSNDQTIVQKIINGNGVNRAVPIVLGISATVQRFDSAMEKASVFTKRSNVEIEPKDVQASGLLKNSLTLDIPTRPATSRRQWCATQQSTLSRCASGGTATASKKVLSRYCRCWWCRSRTRPQVRKTRRRASPRRTTSFA